MGWTTAHHKLALHWGRRVLSHLVRDAVPSDLPVALMIPVAPKDVVRARHAIPLIQQRIAHPISRTVIVAPDHPDLRQVAADLGVEFLLESDPLGDLLGDALPDTPGVIRQQMLKLASPRFLGHRDVLVMDSDTYPLRPMAFTHGGRHILYRGDNNREPFPTFTDALLGPHPSRPPNFIAHSMLFHGPWLEQLFETIEARHAMPWQHAILKLLEDPSNGVMSEYDIYGTFLHRTRPEAFVQPYYAGIKAPLSEFLGQRPLPPWKARFRLLSNHQRP